MSLSTIDLTVPPYVGPVSFTRDQTLYGRDREAQELTGLLISERIVLLYSPSGAGKTSLVQSKLIPELERRDFVVRPVLRVSLGTPGEGGNRYLNSLVRSLQAEGQPRPALPADATFADLLEATPAGAEQRDEVLIFDQFEEILTLDPTDRSAKEEFFRAVGRALLNRGRWALFSMREEYVAALDPYLRLLPTRLSCRFRLDLLGAKAAAQAIAGPAQARGVTITPAAVTRLVDDLRRIQVQGPDGKATEQAGLYVEPVQLQVVCLRLWRDWVARRAPDSFTIGEEDLGAVDNVGDALRAYYDERVAQVAAASAAALAGSEDGAQPQRAAQERAIREWFDRRLITRDGIRGQVLQGYGTTEGLPNEVIHELVDAYLVRSERRGGRTWYELAHDRLIGPVRASNEQWAREHLVPAQVQATLWEEQGRPDELTLRGEKLREAEAWAARPDVVLTEVERLFLARGRELAAAEERERRRTRLIRGLGIGAMVLGAIAVLLAALAIMTRNEAAARQLAAQALQASADSPPRALLLAREAIAETWPLEPLPEAISALQQNLAETGGTPLAAGQRAARTVAFDAAGARVAAAGDDGVVRVWSMADLAAPPLLLRGHTDTVNALAFSPDGRLLASASDDATARVWELSEPDRAPTLLSGQDLAVRTLAFSPDGAWLATGGSGGMLQLWSTTDLAAGPRALEGHTDTVNALAFSPDGRLLASASDDATARVWGLGGPGAAPRLVLEHDEEINTLAFSPDGRTLATGSSDDSVRLWDMANGAQRGDLRGPEADVWTLAFSPDGELLATGRVDGRVMIWQVSDLAAPPTPLAGHATLVSALAFSPDSETLYAAGYDGTLRLWDLALGDDGQIVLHGHDGEIYGMALGASAIATAGADGTVRIWATERLSAVALLRSGTSQILDVGFSSDGRSVASSSSDGSGSVWSLDDPAAAPTSRHPPLGELLELAATPDGRLLVTVDFENLIQLWDLSQAEAGPVELGQGVEPIISLAISPAGDRAAVAEIDGPVTIYDLGNPGATLALPTDGTAITALAFDPDGRRLAGGRFDGGVQLWDLARPDAAPTIHVGHTSTVTELAFSPDGRLLASGDGTGATRLWGAGQGLTARALLRGHEGPVQALAFSPNGRLLATGSSDTMVRLWSVDRPSESPTSLHGRGADITALAFSPDGETLASGDGYGRVRLWPLEPAELAARACATAGRNLAIGEWQQAFDTAPYRKSCEELPASPSLIDAAAELAILGDLAEARALERQIVSLGAADEIPARSWGRLCRAMSLADEAAAAASACDRAVTLDPTDGPLYDWRALNRALRGELASAGEDLQIYIAWAREQALDEEQIGLREQWAAALAAGANPYDEAALALLREEGEP